MSDFIAKKMKSTILKIAGFTKSESTTKEAIRKVINSKFQFYQIPEEHDHETSGDIVVSKYESIAETLAILRQDAAAGYELTSLALPG